MKKYGLPKTSLLRKNAEYAQVYKKGKRLYGENYSLIFKENTLGINRIGISIHRQVKGAAKRNRIKRIIRESFRLNRDIYPPNADIVFAVKPGYPADSPEAVSQAVALLNHADGKTDGKK